MTMQDVQQGAAVYFDGTSSRKHQVTLRLGAALEIVEDGAVVATWPFEAIRRADGATGPAAPELLSAAPLARLEIDDPATIEAVTARCTALDVIAADRSISLRIVFWSAAAIASILAIVVYGLPHARRSVGAAGAVFGRAADGPGGRFAGAGVIRRQGLRGARRQGGVREAGREDQDRGRHRASARRATCCRAQIPNAIALPGGKIYLFNALLQKAGSPDEVAGIIAHELGHAHHRHNMRTLIHNGGSSFLIGLLLGDVTGGSAVIFATRQLLQASHSREAEQEADDFAYHGHAQARPLAGADG